MPNRAGGSSADQFEQDLIAATSASNQRSTTTAPDPFEDDLLAATATGPRRFVVEDPGRAARDPLDGLLPGSAGFADQLARDLTAERDARRRGLPGRTIPNPVTATQGAAYTAEEMAQARAALREVDAAQGENFGNASTDRVVGDTAIDLARGVASIPNAAVRLADIGAAVTGLPQPGAALARRGIDLGAPADALERAQSPELRAAREAADAEGGNNLFASAKAVLTRPTVALSMAAEALPQMFAGAGVGRMVLGKTVGAALLGEAAMTSSGVADAFADQSPTGEITRGQAGLALLAGGVGAVISKTGNKLATALGFDDVDTMLVGVAANPAVRTRLATRVIASGVQEGLFEEAPQSAVEQILTNAGLGQPLLQDVGKAAGQGAVVGGVMGVGAQMAGAGDRAEAQRAAEAEAQLAQEWERGRPERSAAFTAANEAYLAQFTPERAQAIRDARYAETHPTPEGVRGRDPNYGGDPSGLMPPPLPPAPAPATNATPVEAQAPPTPETPQEAPEAADEDLPPLDLAGMSEDELLAALGEQDAATQDVPAEPAAPVDEELPPLDLNGLSEDDLIRAVSESPETPAEPADTTRAMEPDAVDPDPTEPASLAPDDQEAPDGAPDNWHDVVRAARASGFTGTTRELFTAYRDITSFEDATRGADDEYGDVALMRAIAKAGGLKWDGAGETQNLWEASPDYVVPSRIMRKDFKGVLKGRRLPTGRLLGVSRVLRNDGTGLTWDGLREALAQNPQYRHLADAREADIIDLVTTAAERGKQAPPKLAKSAFLQPRWWVDRMADDGSPIGDYASAWSWQAVKRTFDYPEEVAKAVDAVARAIFSPQELTNILLQKGGTPGEGARVQHLGFVERERQKRARRRALPQRGPEADTDFGFGENQWATAHGSMELLEDTGKALIRALNTPNASTAPHELIHVVRVFLLNRDIPAAQRAGITDAMIDAVEAEYGVENGAWTDDQEEAFATDFERYLQRGTAPSSTLADVFARFATWMREVYDTLLGHDLSPRMIGVFDQLLTRQDRLNAPQGGATTDVALPGLEKVRSQALGESKTGPRLATVSAQAPDDGTFRLDAERADGRTLTEREQREEAGQTSMLDDLGLSDTQKAAADELKAMLAQRKKPLAQRFSPRSTRVLYQNDDPMVKLAVTFIMEGAKKGQNLHQVWATFAAYMGEGFEDAKPVFERAGQFLYKRPVTLKANPLAEAPAPAPPKAESKTTPPGAPSAPSTTKTHEQLGNEVAGFGKYPSVKINKLLDYERGYVAYLLDLDPDRITNPRAKEVREWLRTDPAVVQAFGEAFIAGVNQTEITDEQRAALDQAGLTGEVFTQTNGDRRKLMVRLSGGAGAIDAWKSLIAEIGGKRITPGRDWQLNLRGQFAAFVARLRGAASTGIRPSNRRAAYLSDPQLRQLREDLEREDDRSGLDRDPLVRLDPATIAAIRKGEGRVPPEVLTEQLEDIARIAQAHERKTGFYLLASDPGSGKTFVLGGAIQELKRQGAKHIVYVTMSDNLIAQIRRDLSAFDLSDVEFVSYTQLRKRAEGEATDVMIFDESHNAKNDEGAQQGLAAKAWIAKTQFTIFTSATPVENPVEMKYYDATGLFDAAKGYLNWVVAFGASPVRNPDGTIRSAAWINTATAEDDAKAARQWLVKRGVYTSRPIRLPANQVATRMVPVPSDAATKQLYDDIVAAANVVPNMSMNGRMWLKNFQKRITEASKVPLAITRAKEARKAERFPVIFVETKAERSLDIPDILQRENDYLAAVDAWKLQPRDNRPPKPQRGEFGAKPEGIATMLDAYMARTGEKEILIPSAEDVIAEAFGADQVAIYTGSVSNSDAQQNLAAWRAGAKPVLVATMAKGGTGLSLHDTTGTHPTTQIVVTLPWTATSVVQVAQRTARYGMIGTAEIEWLFAEDIDFDKALAARVGTRMANMGATVHGKVSGDAEKIQGWDLDTEAAAKYTRTTAEDDETADSRGETSPRPRFSPRASRADIVATTPPPTTTATTTATPPEGMRERNTDIKKVQGLELPELVELAQTLMKTPRLVKSFRKAGKLGEFNSASGIKILATLASPENLGEVVKTLAHEIGHLIDWLPTQTLKRGNLLGRLYSLDAYLKHTIQGAHGDTVKLGEIDQELTKVSDTWRPWDRANASTEFTKYRNSSKEKYADALSMLLNDPKQFKALAPTFWREWLDGLDAKPEVQDAYESLQTLLNGTAEDLAAHRLDRAEEMFAKGDERQYDIATQRQADRERRTPSKWQQFKSHYLSRNYSAIDRVRYLRTQFKLELPDTVNPVYALEERTHLGSTQKAWVERYVDQVRAALLGAGVNWTHFGVQLMYDRILKGDRTKLGNPLGTTPASAQMTLDKMRAGYSPKQLEVLDAQVAKFRTGMREVAERGHEAGLFGPEQWKNMEENEAYAPFRVLDYMEQDMRATVRHQTGTWKDIQNPADAAILKVLVTISASAHQQAKLKMADMLLSYFRDDIVEAPRTFDLTTKRWVPKEPDNKDLRLVTYLRDGQAHGIHVEPYIAEMLNRSSSLASPLIEILGQANAVWFRPVLTTFNVGFQATNLLRDMWRTWKNRPDISLVRLLRRYWQARGIAVARASDGKREKSKFSRRLLGVSEQAFEQAVEQMLDAEERAILSVSFTRFMSMGDPELTQIDAILVKLGFLPPSSRTPSKAEQWARLQMLKLGQQARKAGAGPAVDLAVKSAGKTGRGIMRVLEGIQRAGDIIEALPKAALLVEEAERAGGITNIRANRRSFIRRKAGSPDFLDLGMSGGSMNKVLLFSNAVIQAWRADAEVMTDPKTRAGWWTRTAVLNILPKVLMALAIGGAFDDDEDEPQDRVSTWMRAIPFYDLLNYLVIPTGIDARGKVHYVRVPQDDFGRIITGVLWNGLANAAGRRDDSALEMARELVKYTAGQFPGPSPAITLPLDAFAAITGQNVLDTFRGKLIFTPDEMDAGGLPKAQKFLRYAYKELGGDVFYKISLDARAEAEPDSAWEVITSIPVAGNLLGRFYKTSDAGIREMGYEAMTKTRAQEARIRLKEKAAREVALDRLFRASEEARPGMRWGLARDIVEQVYADRNADERSQRTAAIVKKLDMGVLRGDSDTLTELVLSAQTNQQKAAAIAQVRTTMSDALFRQWRQQARRVGVISDDLDDLIPAR